MLPLPGLPAHAGRNVCAYLPPANVSIHAPRARGDSDKLVAIANQSFQFTPLVRGATVRDNDADRQTGFNSRPSCEGRLWRKSSCDRHDVSIHAPHARGDVLHAYERVAWWFQFTPLMRGATSARSEPHVVSCFNSRPSCEGRLFIPVKLPAVLFQFTPLMRGATRSSRGPLRSARFNSRPSCEGRHTLERFRVGMDVSIHAPHARGDAIVCNSCAIACVSIHAPHARGDSASVYKYYDTAVSLHAPRARGDCHVA